MNRNKFSSALTTLFFILTARTQTALAEGVYYNVKDYGAKSDGKNLDSKSINREIDKAVKNTVGIVYL